VLQTKRKTLAWIGLATFLVIGGIGFLFILTYAALTASPGYPQDLAVRVLLTLGAVVAFCFMAAIVFAIYLYKASNQHWAKSLFQWFKEKGGSPWEV